MSDLGQSERSAYDDAMDPLQRIDSRHKTEYDRLREAAREVVAARKSGQLVGMTPYGSDVLDRLRKALDA